MSLTGKRRLWLALPVALTAFSWFQIRENHRLPGQSGNPADAKTRTAPPDAGHERASPQKLARQAISSDWDQLLLWLNSHPDPDAVRARLTETKYRWTETDPQALAQALRRLLESGQDAPTGLGFRVGNHGFLADWPTLRVFLLDVLAASDPEMALQIAREILADARSAEEYAIALRSLTRPGLGRAPDAELLDRFDHLLTRPEWQSSPGFAETFDLPRYLGTPDAARHLAASTGNDKLRSMALHEFAAERPAAVIEALKESTLPRADLMARADPQDPAQLAAVDAYLRDPSLPHEDAVSFLKTFPLRSATTGYRLYGKTPAPYTFERIAAGDRQAAALAETWAADPALAPYHAEINALKTRLSKWTEQAR